jgi:hypothetical protein
LFVRGESVGPGRKWCYLVEASYFKLGLSLGWSRNDWHIPMSTERSPFDDLAEKKRRYSLWDTHSRPAGAKATIQHIMHSILTTPMTLTKDKMGHFLKQMSSVGVFPPRKRLPASNLESKDDDS